MLVRIRSPSDDFHPGIPHVSPSSPRANATLELPIPPRASPLPSTSRCFRPLRPFFRVSGRSREGLGVEPVANLLPQRCLQSALRRPSRRLTVISRGSRPRLQPPPTTRAFRLVHVAAPKRFDLSPGPKLSPPYHNGLSVARWRNGRRGGRGSFGECPMIRIGLLGSLSISLPPEPRGKGYIHRSFGHLASGLTGWRRESSPASPVSSGSRYPNGRAREGTRSGCSPATLRAETRCPRLGGGALFLDFPSPPPPPSLLQLDPSLAGKARDRGHRMPLSLRARSTVFGREHPYQLDSPLPWLLLELTGFRTNLEACRSTRRSEGRRGGAREALRLRPADAAGRSGSDPSLDQQPGAQKAEATVAGRLIDDPHASLGVKRLIYRDVRSVFVCRWNRWELSLARGSFPGPFYPPRLRCSDPTRVPQLPGRQEGIILSSNW